MSKLILGLKLGENANTAVLEQVAKDNNYQYMRIGGLDFEHQMKLNNLNQVEYWARVYKQAFDTIQTGKSVALDMDYETQNDITELIKLARDNGVNYVQGAMDKLEHHTDLLNGEKSVDNVLKSENMYHIEGLDAVYVKDLNMEFIKNVEKNEIVMAHERDSKYRLEDGSLDESTGGIMSLMQQYKNEIKHGLIGFLSLLALFLLAFGGLRFYNNFIKAPVEEVIVYSGPKTQEVDTEFVNTNEPIFIEDIDPIVATEMEIVEEVATITEEIIEPVEEKITPKPKPMVKKSPRYGRINPETLPVNYCCTDREFQSWYNVIGEADMSQLRGNVYYVKTDRYVYVIANATLDGRGRVIGGDAYYIKGADPRTIVLLNDHLKVHNFAKDINKIYFKGEDLGNMDPGLVFLECPAGTLQSCFFYDGYYYYNMLNGSPFFKQNLQNAIPNPPTKGYYEYSMPIEYYNGN